MSSLFLFFSLREKKTRKLQQQDIQKNPLQPNESLTCRGKYSKVQRCQSWDCLLITRSSEWLKYRTYVLPFSQREDCILWPRRTAIKYLERTNGNIFLSSRGMTGRGEAKQLRARELQPGHSPSCTQALSHCAAQQRQNEVLSLIQSCFVPVFHQFNTHYLKASNPLAIKLRLLFFLRKGQRKEKKGPSTYNWLHGSISWELQCTKYSNEAVVLVFPEQIEQIMLFISIINIKLYFLELPLEYISALWI